MPGISIITNFDVNAHFPIDSRMVVSDITTRNNIIWVYEGLRVYVLSDKQSYIYQDSTWRVEYNGIYGGSGSLPGNVSVDFGSFGNTVGTSSYYFQYEVDSQSNFLYLQNQFIRNRATTVANSWQGVEFRQQLKYNDGTGLKNSSYISFNPSTNGIASNLVGGIAFGVGYSTSFPEKEAMRISPTGFVGIGTNDPKDFLQIGSSSTSKFPIVIGDSYIGYNYYLLNSVPSYFNTAFGSGALVFETNGRMRLRTKEPNISFKDTMTLEDGKVGIGTLNPREFLEIGLPGRTQLPLVLHNLTDAAIGHNWYYTTSDQFDDIRSGSGRILFRSTTSTGEILFSTRNPTAPNFNSIMILKDSKVGVNTSNPIYALDVTGDIKSSNDIYSGRDVNAAGNVIAADKVETTNGYYFKNSPNNKITSGNEMDFFVANSSPNLKIFSNKIVTYQDFHVADKFLLIYNTTGNLNSKLDKGIVFGEPNSTFGSVIYPYQGASIGEMGLSIYSKSSGVEVESLRISNGGKRIQIGVPSNTSGTHTFNSTTTTVNSQIDTINNLHNTISDGPAPSYTNGQKFINSYSDLLHSGSYNYTQLGSFTVFQYWIRVGRVVQVYFYLTVTTTSVDLSTLYIKTPVRPISDSFGTWIGYLDSTNTARNGFIKKSTANDWSIIIKDDSDDTITTGTNIDRMTGNYTLEVTI